MNQKLATTDGLSSTRRVVSIGMPVYNGEKFIRNALNSLLAQTFTNFEFIISDNASTDDTEKIVREYANRDSRIRYIRQNKNIGAIANFKFVLDQATGDYFCWAAHDDWWDSIYLEELVRILNESHEVVIAFCAMQWIDLNGRVLWDGPLLREIEVSRNKSGLKDAVLNSSFKRYQFQKTTHGKANLIYGLARREILVIADPLQRWLEWKEDWGTDLLIVATILRYGEVKFSSRSLWKKTDNPDSAGSSPKRSTPTRTTKAIAGAINSYRQYLKYVLGVWQVQGDMPGAEKINSGLRIFFTVHEFARLTSGFTGQSCRALSIRCKKAIGL